MTNLSGDEWDRTISDFADVYYEQTECLQGMQWGDNRVRRVAITINGKIAAMALVLVFTLPVVKRGLALIKYGPLWRRKGEPADRRILGLALDALVDQFVTRERLALSIMPPPDPRFADIYGEELRLRGLKHRVPDGAERFLVNMTLTPDRQMASLDQRWRRNLRSALKSELTIGVEAPSTSVAEFTALCMSMKERKNYSNPVWPLFERALSDSRSTETSSIVVLARENGTPVAGAVVFQIGDTAYYAVGASSDRGVDIKAGYALHWWIIDWLRGRQCHWYDLGEATPESGLWQFKKGLVGKEGTIALSPGEYTRAPDLPGILAAHLLLGVRRARLAVRALVRDFKELVRSRRREQKG
ncbi:GNAT family N-acetyltransferase [Nordella sp. HKS 07]|uniref:lipid II:glycine glycyltransferase FemX n=1 Tax=Nordella sp. HKS 07 TaxID=2712222 RepID=UPI0013E16F00|nr:GNAT family N-acetyltransferase [Nordella sp. HKS 07]QIG48956.1 GNAT family N-acetyltransferase [Nordella sp. HKS 07]